MDGINIGGGGTTPPPDFTVTDQNVSDSVKELNNAAQALVQQQGGTLTTVEKASLEGLAQGMLEAGGPTLPAPDKQALTNFLSKLSAATISDTHIDTSGVSIRHAGNPFMNPGVMAYMAPIMSELSKIYAEIMRESSQMKQNMMGLMTAMAEEAYNFGIAAGKAEVKKLDAEILGAELSIGASAASIGMAGAQLGVSRYTSPEKGAKSWAEGQNTKENLVANGRVDCDSDVRLTPKYKEQLATSKKSPQDFEKSPEYLDLKKDFATKNYDKLEQEGKVYKYSESDYINTMEYRNKSQTHQNITSVLGTTVQQTGQIMQSSAQIVAKTEEKSAVMDKAKAEAMEKFLNTVIQVVTDTMRTFGDENQRADKDWQSFNQLFRDMASTIRQAIYGQA